MFPPIGQQIIQFGMGLMIGIAMVGSCLVVCYIQIFKKQARTPVAYTIQAFVFPVGLVLLFSLASPFLVGMKLRKALRPERITAIRVQKLVAEEKLDPGDLRTVSVQRESEIKTLLDSLRNATSRPREHENFSKGYRVTMLLDSGDRVILDVYLSSNRASQSAIVGTLESCSSFHSGYYNNPGFATLVSRWFNEGHLPNAGS